MAFYRICPDCGAYLDPGEQCSCHEECLIEMERKEKAPIVREAVKRLGFREICLDENQDAVRAHFFKIYSTLIERKTNDTKLPPSILEAKNKYIAQLTTHENAAIEQQHRDQIAEEPERATPEYIDMLMREHGFKR